MHRLYVIYGLLTIATIITISTTHRVAAENSDDFFGLLFRADSLGQSGNVVEADSLLKEAAEIVDESNALALPRRGDCRNSRDTRHRNYRR